MKNVVSLFILVAPIASCSLDFGSLQGGLSDSGTAGAGGQAGTSAPAVGTGGGSGRGGNVGTATGGPGGQVVTSTSPTVDAGGGSGGIATSAPAGGATSISAGGTTATSMGGTTTVAGGSTAPIGGTKITSSATGGTTYVPPVGGSTYVPPSGGSTYVPPNGGSTYIPPSGGTTYFPPVGGSTSVSTGGATATCTPVPKSTGGLSCPNGLCTVGAYSGYEITFGDKIASSVCMLPNSLCGAGTVGAQNPAGGYTVWGAGFGFSLSPQTTLTSEVPVQLTGTGVRVTVTSLPTNADMRLQVKHYVGTTPTTYCAVMTTATQTIPWTSFNTMCWAPASGVALTGPPNTSNIQFQASSRPTAGSFDFCVTALSFQ
ncbi:MAG: hypothetical protein WCG85_12880 [Polyangia bacterium]